MADVDDGQFIETPAEFTLHGIREQIFADWRPEWGNGESKDAQALATNWAELRAVAQVGAWSSVIVHAGRILERSLKVALQSSGIGQPGAPALKTLNGMLKAAQPSLLPRGTDSAANAIAGDNLRRLRNLSAHFGELTPSELAATQALAILLVFVEALHPKDPAAETYLGTSLPTPDEWFLSNWRDISPNVLARWMIAADDNAVLQILEPHADELLARLARATSSRALTRLPARIAAFPEHRQKFGLEIHRNFPGVLTTLSKGVSGNWRRFIGPLPSLGLSQHAKVLSALLPYDSKWLIEKLSAGSSPHRVTRSVLSMRATNHQQWALLGVTEDERSTIATSAWAGWNDDKGYSFAANRFLLALAVKPALGAEIARAAPREAMLVYIAEVANAAFAVRAVRLALAHREFPRPERDVIWLALRQRVAEADLKAVRSIPFVVHRIGIATGFAGEELMRLCMTKPAIDLERRRLLSGVMVVVWLVSRSLRPTVVERARALAKEGPPDWVTLTTAGILEISGSPPPGVVRRDFDIALLELHIPPDAGRDELGLALLGLLTLKPTARPLIDVLHRRFSEATADRSIVMPHHGALDRRFEFMVDHVLATPQGAPAITH